MTEREFTKLIMAEGRRLYRDMPWRRNTEPYYVLVSEMMLQQTQVGRVIPKFLAFMAAFPDVESLARASLSEVLRQWQGLGYNRRAKYLHDAARQIVARYAGVFPDDIQSIRTLPGVGVNTGGAIVVYAFDRPAIFIETNIRTVYIHHFFADHETVDDREIAQLVSQTMPAQSPREFYWALMDYGAHLKSQGVRTVGRSRHYRRQSPLAGSVREVRGRIIRELSRASCSETDLRRRVQADERFERALEGLRKDGLVERIDRRLRLTK